MPEVSTFRLRVLRGLYLLIAVGLALTFWPLFRTSAANTSHMAGVVRSILAAVSLLALLGLRYPLEMLPLLLFELTWKVIWVAAYGLPLWQGGALTAGTRESLSSCLAGIVLVSLALPWGYVFRHYLAPGGARWRGDGGRPFDQ